MRILEIPPLHATMNSDELVATLTLGTEDVKRELEDMLETELTDEQLWQIWKEAAELMHPNFMCEMEHIRDYPSHRERIMALVSMGDL
jgi:hypothetical protein